MPSLTATIALICSVAAASVSAEAISLLSSRSASPIHFAPLNAYQEGIWIGRPTQSYCPPQVQGCKTVNSTAFAIGDGISSSMYVSVPGGQQLYVDADGALKYTIAHSANQGQGSTPAKLTVKPLNAEIDTAVLNGQSMLACPASKGSSAYQVFASAHEDPKVPTGDVNDCLGFTALVGHVGEEAMAWQYQ
ncbi:hypothetical protein KEM52_000827 [Ascosphaera acerosa]|nr:hypothetical protein KEM52_000827 [Ascosphaera acerosa]